MHKYENHGFIIGAFKISLQPLILGTCRSVWNFCIQADKMGITIIKRIIGLGAIRIVVRKIKIAVVERAFIFMVSYGIIKWDFLSAGGTGTYGGKINIPIALAVSIIDYITRM